VQALSPPFQGATVTMVVTAQAPPELKWPSLHTLSTTSTTRLAQMMDQTSQLATMSTVSATAPHPDTQSQLKLMMTTSKRVCTAKAEASQPNMVETNSVNIGSKKNDDDKGRKSGNGRNGRNGRD
jgi:hypothetical protein